MDLEPFDAQLFVRGRNRWLLGLSAAPALLAVVLLAISVTGLPTPALLLFFSGFGAFSLLRKNPAPVVREVRVQVDPGILRIGSREIPRPSLRDAQIVPLRGGSLVVRVWPAKRLPIDLVVGNQDEGRHLLRALGFDASQTVTKFRTTSSLMGHWMVRSGAAFVVFIVMGLVTQLLLESMPMAWGLAMKAMVLVFAATATASAIPSRVDVGADGVLVTWLGTKRFLPLSQIRAVERSVEGWGGRNRLVGARITMDDGSVVWIPVGAERWADERAGALIERIREAMDTNARGSVDAAAALLGRRARDVRAWIQELRALGAGANVDLRTAPVNPEHLWRIVESHAAGPEDRAAAAVALGGQLDDSGKQRLRVAVDAVADERLRLAIDATVNADDAALEAALGEMSDAQRV